MNSSIMIVGIIGVIALIAFILLFRKKDSIYRFIRPGKVLLVLLALGVIFILCFLFIGNKIYRNGTGDLVTDYDEEGSDTNLRNNGDTIIITVSLDKILIGDSTFSSVAEAQKVIAEAVSAGKNIRVIDDYALATTYNQLIDFLVQMNVSRQGIEEIRQP